MIIKGKFSEAGMKRSQRFYTLYAMLNGFSYMCLGETVILLLAMKLDCKDYVVSTIGAMLYFSYVILPSGKLVAARVGAASSQAVFWILRNFAALLVASSVIWAHYGMHGAAVACLLIGAFMFYGFRAAGVVMIQPLVGNITTSSNRSAFLAISTAIAYVSSLLALLGISAFLHFYDGIWPLAAVIATGSVFGFSSAYFIKNIDETNELRLAAQMPLFAGMREAFRKTEIKRQIYSGLAMNMAVIMLMPISMVIIKRGYGLSDKTALLYSIVQLAGSVVLSRLSIPFVRLFGPRRILIGAYSAFMLLALAWAACPAKPHAWFIAIMFFSMGGIFVAETNSTTHYFLQCVKVESQVTASIIIAVIAGGLGGLLATIASGVILKVIDMNLGSMAPINRYRFYFLVAMLILSPGLLLIKRLVPLPLEKKEGKISRHDFF